MRDHECMISGLEVKKECRYLMARQSTTFLTGALLSAQFGRSAALGTARVAVQDQVPGWFIHELGAQQLLHMKGCLWI